MGTPILNDYRKSMIEGIYMQILEKPEVNEYMSLLYFSIEDFPANIYIVLAKNSIRP